MIVLLLIPLPVIMYWILVLTRFFMSYTLTHQMVYVTDKIKL